MIKISRRRWSRLSYRTWGGSDFDCGDSGAYLYLTSAFNVINIHMLKRFGFTMIELLVVIAVIGIRRGPAFDPESAEQIRKGRTYALGRFAQLLGWERHNASLDIMAGFGRSRLAVGRLIYHF